VGKTNPQAQKDDSNPEETPDNSVIDYLGATTTHTSTSMRGGASRIYPDISKMTPEKREEYLKRKYPGINKMTPEEREEYLKRECEVDDIGL
jgi:hypothetical protein